MKKPLISIVIANYNYGHYLEEAILSVLSQCISVADTVKLSLSTGETIELIIVDGGSSDNSIQVIQKYADKLAWWCSEPDRGQSDAFNKGFAHARGRFFTWLNADDIFFPGSLERARQQIYRYPLCEWFVAGCMWLDQEMRVIKCSNARTFSRLRAERGEISVWAPSSFFSRELFKRAGGVDVDFHYSMDTELWFRFYRWASVMYRPIKGYCWGLRLHPAAKMSGHNFENSELSQEMHPRWAQLKKEGKLFHSRYGYPKSNKFVKWITTSPLIFMKNKLDTWRFRNKFVSECFNLF